MQKVLFLDVETALIYRTWADVPEDGKLAFTMKFGYRIGPGLDYEDVEAAYKKEAGLLAEFTKIVCIVIGSFIKENPKDATSKEIGYLRAIKGEEAYIIGELFAAIDKFDPDGSAVVCAHNGKKFDFPLICRRATVLGVVLHTIFDVVGKKPWETRWHDTVEMWTFTDNRHYASLLMLCFVLGIPSPKDEMDGSMVSEYYYTGKIDDIVKYCIKDVFALMNVWRKFKGMHLLENMRVAA